MSAICHGFVQNAWRKDICSNCFRVRDEHSAAEISNSVTSNGIGTGSSSGPNNGVNISSIVPNNNSNNNNTNYGNKSGNDTNVVGAADAQGKSQSVHNKFNRFQGTSNSSPTCNSSNNASASGQGSTCSGIPRMNNNNSGNSSTTATNTSGNVGGKISGTNGGGGNATVSTLISKGHHNFNSANRSQNDRNNSSENHDASSAILPETNGKGKSTEAITTVTKITCTSSLSTSNNNIQGKGVMTNQHPSKSDNRGVTSNQNNNKQLMSSSAVSHQQERSTACAYVSSSSSSFIASKNIFNTSVASTVTASTGCSSTTTAGSTCCVNVNGTGVPSSSASTGLSHPTPQSATSIRRGSINNFTPALSSTSTTVQVQQSQKSGVVVVDVTSGTTGGVSGSHKNLETSTKHGVIENSVSKTKELSSSDGVSNVKSNSGGSSGVLDAVSVVNKGGVISQQNGMNKPRISAKPTDVTDGEVERRFHKNVSVSGGGENPPGKVGASVSKSGNHTKGILRKKNGAKKGKNVRFPDEVVKVIGYGGGPSGVSDDEDDSPPHPLDSASVAEVMEKNSTTSEEKELNRLTQKNTNFNSIKTNLLGTTCIEIGPIVGCTGGKSMEGSSKPLVSIGTFDTRKEPLRIQKKISEDSADDELNEKTVEKHRKFIPRSSGSSTTNTTGKSSSSSTNIPSKIGVTPGSSNKEFDNSKQQQTTSSSSSSSSQSSTTKAVTNKATFSSSTTTTTLNKTSLSTHSKASSSVSNKSTPEYSSDKGSGSSTISATTIEVNPEQTSQNNNATRGSKDCLAPLSNSNSGKSNSIKLGTTSTSTTNTVTSNRFVSSNNSSSSAFSTSNHWNSTTSSFAPSTDCSNPSRPKPVLKRLQQQKNTNSDSSEGFTVNAAVVETNTKEKSTLTNGVSSTNTANLHGRNNLIVLTNGDKAKVNGSSNISTNNSSIASKRNSFLRDIIVDSSSATIETSGGIDLHEPSAVQVICKNNKDESLMKTELKVDLKPSVNNGKLSHPPFGECLSNRSNGTDDSSEFDDSLEDSGLDIKKCSEISESDEKSGSGSDSGNENDYSERDRVKIIPAAGPKSGLFISVEEVEGTTKKPEKLSPDSVLFSSASEMSASGSSESIPEALDTISDGGSQKDSASSEDSQNDVTNNGSVSTTVKRAAPRPPSNPVGDSSSRGHNAIYANSQAAAVVEVEGIYDDVSFYKNPMHFPPKGDKIPAFEEEDEEENIYDDCTTVTAIPNEKGNNGKPAGKSAIGSYSFQNGSNNTLDSDGEEEKVVHRRSDGIEFIGIRKIDSESFLRERSPTPERSPDGKRERSSSASPKPHRRKMNQFFSTIGKKAGAAFSQHVHGYSKNKSSSTVDDVNIDKSPSGNSSAYKRSLSTDEVSMTRTQEIYATLTPTSLKFKGLAPVLHKLSKMDLNMGDKDKGYGDFDDDKTDSKSSKKHKISSSIKKFLRFGSKEGGDKYDFGNCQNKTEINGYGQPLATQITEESDTSRTPTPTNATVTAASAHMKLPERKPSYGTMSGRPPPPPPPRVHSLDLLTRVGVAGPNGTVRPARPPPPTRHNRVAPSFTSVFTNPNADAENKANGTNSDNASSPTSPTNKHGSSQQFTECPDPNNPPSKPKRKASMNLDCVTNGASRDLESTYNHITTLNLETLKLIASQTPTKIRRYAKTSRRISGNSLKWSHFYVPEPMKPLIQGPGFVFYSAFWDDESCVLLVQESATAPHFSAPFEFPCVETSATFEDYVPSSYVTWTASDYVTSGNNVKVFVSVMPKYSIYTVESYMRHSQVPLLHKYFALLQAMNYWDKEDLSDLLVLVQSMEETDSHFLTNTAARGGFDVNNQPGSPSTVLVYVHPIPHISTSAGTKSEARRSSSKTQLCLNFESSMKQILLSSGPDGATPLLGENDRQVVLKRLNETKARSVQDQFRLFLQVKLFAPKRDSDELERINKLRSERAIQQWIDRERALCMKEAVEQTLQRNIESSISPYKRSYLEFLLTPENSAKAVLDMLIDLLE